MEMYLKSEKSVFRFPVLPPSINIQDYAVTNDSNLAMLGDIIVYGGKGLRTTEVTSFFPSKDKNYKFVNYSGYSDPWKCIKTLNEWMQQGEILRFIVTDTEINFQVIITNFEYAEQDGTRDVYFTLNLREYRPIKISSTKDSTKEKTDNKDRGNSKKDSTKKEKTTQKTYTVKSGDTLWDIAKKYYGKGSDYTKIISKNKAKYPSLAKSSVIKVGWNLII